MFEKGHFCLAIILKGKCDESGKKKIYEDTVSRFLSELFPRNEKEAHYLMWNPVERSPLFEPTLNQECEICSSLIKLFEKKKGKGDCIIWFSHNILDMTSFKAFFSPILEHEEIEKIYYLELDHEAEGRFQNNVKVNHNKIKSSELFTLKEKNEFNKGVLYEILN